MTEAGQGETLHNDIPFSLKATLVDDRGVPYRDFRSTLTPRWGRIWLHIACGYVAIVALLTAVVAWAEVSATGIALAVVAGIGIGYALEYLSNFFHEAAHHNLLPQRRWNDRVTNIVFAWMFGRSIAAYRRTHWHHHRALGTTMDSENSYFDALRIRYLVAGLTGLKAFRALRRYAEIERQARERGDVGPEDRLASRLWWIGVAVTVDLGVAAVLWFGLGAPIAAATWLWAILFMFPFFGSLRQLLEHRSDEADPMTDYRTVEHGPVNRLFGSGPVASTFGSAGFNRHALHHWEPQLSYTRLSDIEQYLLRTPLASTIRKRQTTYADTFLRLLEL